MSFKSCCAAIALLALGLMSSGLVYAKNDLARFAGTWQINLAKTKMNRWGPNGRHLERGPRYTWIFTPQGDGLRMDLYDTYPQPAPTRTTSMTFDAGDAACRSHGICTTSSSSPQDQVYRYRQIDAHMLARAFYVKDKVDEYSIYALSADTKVLTVVSWSPETPEWQNIQVFDRLP